MPKNKIDQPFSAREREVMDFLLQGKPNKEIALGLGITERTVESHLSSIYAKLGVSSRTEAVIRLSERSLRESTGGSPGNPQLKTGLRRASLSSKAVLPVDRFRRFRTKNFIRICIVLLLAILIITLVIVAFSLLRQA
ncbi:response regulator containing a CheY-like receiver domain and an HTH DNA-binding domain [Longilinea arvoryzae]|uniref:Response regulator containing a CheY-like receiver domain and an HTH DNA-binding domain n=1 Tax=Longilinea arvoryzae TaxID=360412 RepID=A0A0S7B6X2_9CHLR|nr:response regulator transcription factor [Longilinea arvoryzae]GAP12991.1 response regulator containing a CheY-like receiver domain and an HTH DNA-binding domain [Longilinea arvoryzae]